jgi:hypothetical protein
MVEKEKPYDLTMWNIKHEAKTLNPELCEVFVRSLSVFNSQRYCIQAMYYKLASSLPVKLSNWYPLDHREAFRPKLR